MIRKNCEMCDSEFEYEPPANYPDKRKYCYVCAEKKKQQWDSRTAPKVEENGPVDAPVERPGTITSETSYSSSTGVALDDLEYQIRSREVRCRALESAIAIIKDKNQFDQEDILAIADKFVEWIYG